MTAIVLWHPDSPGSKVWLRPGLLRRMGIRRSEFATISECLKAYREAPIEPYEQHPTTIKEWP